MMLFYSETAPSIISLFEEPDNVDCGSYMANGQTSPANGTLKDDR